MTTSDQTKTKIVIIGAGYGGLLATLRLAGRTRRSDVELCLVNAGDSFIPRIQLHEMATGQQVKTRPLAKLLQGKNVNFVQGWVRSIQPDVNILQVDTESGPRQIDYDYLVYALGSRVERDAIPGVEDHAYTLDFHGERTVEQLQHSLPELAEQNGRVVIVGGGPTGVEVATEIKDIYPALQVSIYTAGKYGILPGKERVQPALKSGTEKLGITVHEYARVKEVGQKAIVLDDGERIPYDLCIWAGGFKAPPIAGDAGITVNNRGQILVNPHLCSVSHANIFALGDSSHPVEEPGSIPRMGVYYAVVTGLHTADTLRRLLRGKSLKPLSFAYMGQGVGLGRRNAVGFYSFPDDNPRSPFIFTGRLGFYVRGFFVWFLNSLILLERKFPGAFYWFGRNRYKKFQQHSQKIQPSTQIASE